MAPKTPANIGAVARVCANFEAPELVLVAPRCDPADGDIVKVASGAEEVVQGMRVVEQLQDALADTVGSVGFTRRAGATRYTHSSVTDMLQKFPSAITALDPTLQQQQDEQQHQPAPSAGITALVFGREESGLTEAELRLCAHACAIQTGRMQASMNLSHAVAVVLSGLFERRLALLGFTENPGLDVRGAPTAKEKEALQPAAASEVQALLSKVAAIAEAAGLSGADSRGGGAQGSHGRRRLPVGHIRALLSRASINAWEVRSLHGLASAVLSKVQPAAAAGGDESAQPAAAVGDDASAQE